MNLHLQIAPRLWALGLLSLAACAGASTNVAPAPVASRAVAGDTISLVQYYVRPEGRAPFEQFIRDSYWPAVQRVQQAAPAGMRGFGQTRVIFPVRPNPDGTFTYIFLLDPFVSGEGYRILTLLQAVYPAQEAEQRYRQWAETWARPFSSQLFVQSGPAVADSARSTAAPASQR